MRESANSASAAPNSRIEQGRWRLDDLISVASELDIFPSERADSIDQILRDYRNFVHAKKEIKAGHPCTEAEALMAGSLDGVCNHLEGEMA